MPQPVKNSINRSRSQSQLNESIPLKSRDDGSTLVSRSQQKLQAYNNGVGQDQSEWERKID